MADLVTILLAPCHARIEIGRHQSACQVALGEYSAGDQSQKLVFWCDGSHRQNIGSGFAIVWRNTLHGGWDDRGFMLDSKFDNNLAEFFAFFDAMTLAVSMSRGDPSVSKIIIYTDSQYVLESVRDYHTRAFSQRLKFSRQLELAHIKRMVNELHLIGIQVIFRWVPGHSNIPGNVQADKLAGKASLASRNSSLIPLYQPLANSCIEPPPKTKAQMKQEKQSLRQIRHGRIEKEALQPKRTPLNKLYATQIEWSINEIETGVQNSFLDIIKEAVDQKWKENLEEIIMEDLRDLHY